MLLSQLITSNPPKKEPSEKPPIDFLASNIIKAVDNTASISKPKSVVNPQKHALFDMFHEKQEETNKALKGDKFFAKAISKKRDIDEKKNVKGLFGEKPEKRGGYRFKRSKKDDPEEMQEEFFDDEKEKAPKKPKKEEVKLKPVSNEYLQAMSRVSDLDSLLKLTDGEIAQLTGRFKEAPKKVQLLKKTPNIELEEEMILKKLNNKEINEPSKALKQFDSTAIRADVGKGKILKPNEKVAEVIKKPTEANIKPREDLTNIKKTYDPLAMGSANPSHQKNAFEKKPLTSNKPQPNAQNNNPKPKQLSQPSQKPYNPLEISNKPSSDKKPALKVPPKPTANVNSKRPLRELYSDEEEEEEEMDSFIVDDVEEDQNVDYRKEIRKLMRYDPKKYGNDEDFDDAAMEVGFNEIEKEEHISSKYGKIEDEQELKYIMKEKIIEEKKKKKK